MHSFGEAIRAASESVLDDRRRRRPLQLSPPLPSQQASSFQLLRRLSVQLTMPRASQSYYLQLPSPTSDLHHQDSSAISPTPKPPLTPPPSLSLRGYHNEI